MREDSKNRIPTKRQFFDFPLNLQSFRFEINLQFFIIITFKLITISREDFLGG